MWYSLLWGRRGQSAFLGCVLLLLCVSTAVGDPKPLSKDEQAKVDRAIDKGVAFLKKTQTKGGVWPCKKFPETFPVAHCALPAYALLESGVATDAPLIQRAAVFLRHNALRTTSTYEISLALLFFDRLGDAKDKKLIQSLALRLIAGQFRTGGWSYQNYALTEKQETTLLALLEELNERMETAGKSRAESLEELDVPRKYRTLTVFQEARKLNWMDLMGSSNEKHPLPLVGMTDNSNTQFALLGLWAAQRHGIPLNATFSLAVERFERSQSVSGQWGYIFDTNPHPGRYPGSSMTCVGLLGLAIGRGTKLPTPGLPAPGHEDLRVLGGLTALYQDIGIPIGSMDNQVPLQNVYYLWSVERVAMLYNLPTIGDKDWYRWGAEILVTNQLIDGTWPGLSDYQPATRDRVRPDYGATVNTAFALLFLKRAHPMKDLTPKLPFTAKELNAGIAKLRSGEKPPEGTTTTPRESRNRNP
jgi:hypothetical protein